MKAFQSGRLLTAVIVTLFSGGLGPEITGRVQLAILVQSGRGGRFNPVGPAATDLKTIQPQINQFGHRVGSSFDRSEVKHIGGSD